MGRRREIKVGDKVAYSVQFLRAIHCYTGRMPAARGTVVSLESLGQKNDLAVIEWHNWPEMKTGRVLVYNLAHVGPNSKFAG